MQSRPSRDAEANILTNSVSRNEKCRSSNVGLDRREYCYAESLWEDMADMARELQEQAHANMHTVTEH